MVDPARVDALEQQFRQHNDRIQQMLLRADSTVTDMQAQDVAIRGMVDGRFNTLEQIVDDVRNAQDNANQNITGIQANLQLNL